MTVFLVYFQLTLYFVDVETSWTVAGETVSHHVLVQGVAMFVCLQYGLVHLLTTFRI